MKNKLDTNSKLGIVALGLFFANLGFFINKYVKDTSLLFMNGLKDGVSVGLEIIGVAMCAYGIASIVKEKREK